MSRTPIQKDGSEQEPRTEPNEQQNVDNPGGDEANSQADDIRPDRNSVIERIAAMADEDRAIVKGTRQEDMPAGEPVPSEEEDLGDPADEGLQSRQQMHEDDGDPNALPPEYADDPLAEFIVMDGDEPMFRTVVHGREELIPLEKARAQIQKHEAADRRLQQAAERDKQLEQREHAIQQREAEFEQRTRQLGQDSNPTPSATDAPDDEALEKEAREVVHGFFTGTEDEAAAKLVALLKRNRGAVQRATPGVDIEELEKRAVAAARRELTEAELKRDATKGYKRFTEDYPEIAADDNLFRFADSMTDAIAEEHPDWMPSEVMLEAGKRVREWVESQKTPEQSPPTNDRQQRHERKRQLKPIPQSRSATPPREPAEQPPETPQDALAEIRKARGQVS